MTDDRHEQAEQMLAEGHAVEDVALTVGVTSRTVYRWKAAGKVDPDSRADPDKHDSESRSDPATNGRPTGKPPTLAEAKRRKQAALAEKHELDTAERRGELVTRDHVRDIHLRYRSAIYAIPRLLLSDVTELLELPQREVLPLLEKVVDKCRDHVRAEVEKWADEEAPDGS